MPLSSAGLLPFYGQYPAGYMPPATTTGASSGKGGSSSTSSSSAGAPVDIVDIRSSRGSGTFTGAAGDMFALRDLYTGTAPSGGSIAGYKVALRSDAPDGALLMLGNTDVTGRTDFTADEFGQLHFVTGPSGSKQDLVVVAQTGTPGAITDSPAVQITASVTGARSINAVGALLTQPAPTDSDAAFVRVAREASVFTGFGSHARPGLSTVGNPNEPQIDLDLLPGLLGAFQTSAPPATPAIDLLSELADGLGGSQSGGGGAQQSQAIAPWALGVSELGGFQTGGSDLGLQQFAVAAYQASQRGNAGR